MKTQKSGKKTNTPRKKQPRRRNLNKKTNLPDEFKVNCAMELFRSICESLEISPETSSEWMDAIRQQYAGGNRHFHNVQMLEKKLELIEEFAGEEPFKKSLVLATMFQYFHYDVKRDLKQENCEEFKRFVDKSGIKDVSGCIPSFVAFSFTWNRFRKISRLKCLRCFRTNRPSQLKLCHIKSTCSMTLTWLFWARNPTTTRATCKACRASTAPRLIRKTD